MEEKPLTENESLLLIRQMIDTAKQEQKDDGRGWILWGWMLLLASVLTVLNIYFGWFSTFFFWNVFGAFSILYFLYKTVAYFFFQRKERVKTYTGDLFARLNAGFFVSLMFIIISINVGARVLYQKYGTPEMTPINMGFALLINLYAFWVLIYGTALNFRPSVIAAYCMWAIGIAALFINNFEPVMLLHALAVLIGYIIPGYIANREFRKVRRTDKAIARV